MSCCINSVSMTIGDLTSSASILAAIARPPNLFCNKCIS